MSDEFDGIYAPIVGSDETSSPRKPVETNPAVLARTNRLRREFDELRSEMVQELNSVEERLAQPAEDAKSFLVPMKKTIKKRNDKKVGRDELQDVSLIADCDIPQSDFERYQSRVDGLLHKQKRSERDNANLTKAEADLANAKQVPKPPACIVDSVLIASVLLRSRRGLAPSSANSELARLFPRAVLPASTGGHSKSHAGTLLHGATHLLRGRGIPITPTTNGPCHPKLGNHLQTRPGRNRKPRLSSPGQDNATIHSR